MISTEDFAKEMHKITSVSSEKFFTAFIEYVEEWRELEREYYKIPAWRIIKQIRNIKKRETLTRVYTARMKHWGVIK